MNTKEPLRHWEQLKKGIPWLGMIVLLLCFYFLPPSPPLMDANELTYSEFLNEVRAGHLEDVQIKEKIVTGYRKGQDNSLAARQHRFVSAARLPSLSETELVWELEAQHVRFSGSPEKGSDWLLILSMIALPLLLLASLYVSRLKRFGQSGALTFGKTHAKIYDQAKHLNVNFEDVAGVDEAKAELVEVVDFLKNAAQYQRLGGRIPRGVLLVGPPGTGKTLLAKAVAGEAGVAFFSLSGSEFVEMFVGVGAARVRDLFEQAKAEAPCIVFIDELDAVGKSRSNHRISSNEEREQTLNQLLVEMDGFDTSKGVIIMAATNAPELLDPALVRPGRFDRQVVVDRPDVTGREQILRVHARRIKLSPRAELAAIAARTPGLVGADLANVINEAALLATRRKAEEVQMSDLEEAIDRVMLGLQRHRRVMTPDEKERVAYHETGHTLTALSVQNADPVHRISIIPRSNHALGYTLQLPTHERFLLTQPELEDRVAVLLGGRAAEKIIFAGVISTGATDDLEKASELARQMIMHFGMSKHLGPLAYGSAMATVPSLAAGLSEERNFSERTAQRIDEEARSILEEIESRVSAILEKKQTALHVIANALIRKETLTRPEIDELLASQAALEAQSQFASLLPVRD
ncbi:MAG: ATP-dependent zinc metalloprotease FtsH [Acidobacteriaceae bacterium]|nr:ATP-dependent zinc metalloprotease FtsH [Acidobacteriaceae bacterium]